MSLLAFAWFPTFSALPLLVFLAELCVVTLSTLRIIFLSRGMKILAPLLGFFEITIWLFAIGKVMQNLSDPGCFLGFAGGFTLGNFFGVLIEKWLALGTVVVRAITRRDPADLIESLRAAQFGVTSLDAEGAKGPVKVVFTVVRRKELEDVLVLVRQFDPNAFYSVDEIQEAGPGIFPERRRMRGAFPLLLQPSRRFGRLATDGTRIKHG
jgi:uncharacterized protein YebE (UPF0316 family)